MVPMVLRLYGTSASPYYMYIGINTVESNWTVTLVVVEEEGRIDGMRND